MAVQPKPQTSECLKAIGILWGSTLQSRWHTGRYGISINVRVYVSTLYFLDYIHSLRVSFPFYLFICTIRFLASSVVTYHTALTFVNQLVRNSLSLIYKGIRLYSQVTNLGPEGKQDLRVYTRAFRLLRMGGGGAWYPTLVYHHR